MTCIGQQRTYSTMLESVNMRPYCGAYMKTLASPQYNPHKEIHNIKRQDCAFFSLRRSRVALQRSRCQSQRPRIGNDFQDLGDTRQAYLESQVSQNSRPLHPEVAHDPLKVAHSCRPLAFQIQFRHSYHEPLPLQNVVKHTCAGRTDVELAFSSKLFGPLQLLEQSREMPL